MRLKAIEGSCMSEQAQLSREDISNICKALNCSAEDIECRFLLKGGLTNKSTVFSVDGTLYVYRNPGAGTEAIIDRSNEALVQGIVRELGLDGTFVYEDPDLGWKVSRYLENCEPFSCHNEEHLQRAMKMARTLHNSGKCCKTVLDMHEDTLKQMELLDEAHVNKYNDYQELFEMAQFYDELVKADGLQPVLCHNDFYDPNFLIDGPDMHLIDWEYAGMSDYASDLAVFICCSDYTYEEALHALDVYFGRKPTDEELLHCIAYLCTISFHWLVWALYRDQCGEPVGELEFMWHRYARSYGEKAKMLCEEMGR